MQRKINLSKYLVIITNILLLFAMVIYLITKKDMACAIYWILVSLMLICEVFYVHTWSRIGIDLDHNKSKSIKRSFDDATAIIIVLSGLMYLSVMFLEMIQSSIKSNIYVIIFTYSLLTIALLFNYLSVYSANKETTELIEKTFNKRKGE